MSTPAALNALKALAVEVVIAGNTTAFEATMSWQAVDPRKSTHSSDSSWNLDLELIESARPLNMDFEPDVAPG